MWTVLIGAAALVCLLIALGCCATAGRYDDVVERQQQELQKEQERQNDAH